MRSASRETSLQHLLADVTGGPAVLARLNQVRTEIAQRHSKSVQAVRTILERFHLPADNLATQAFLEFVAAWNAKNRPSMKPENSANSSNTSSCSAKRKVESRHSPRTA